MQVQAQQQFPQIDALTIEPIAFNMHLSAPIQDTEKFSADIALSLAIFVNKKTDEIDLDFQDINFQGAILN